MTTIQKPTTPVLLKDLGTIHVTATSKRKARCGIYLCYCGAEFRAQVSSVKSGHTQSCGCFRKKLSTERSTTHGLNNHPLYSVWKGITQRTTNPNNKNFKDYGDRGISVCYEWQTDFKKFFNWCYENGYDNGLQIDRINNDGNYEPSNCRFVTSAVNTRNKRRIMVTNTSGYRGVSFRKDTRKWTAGIGLNAKRKHLGSFATPLEAAIAYDSYVLINNLEHTINGVISHNDELSLLTKNGYC